MKVKIQITDNESVNVFSFKEQVIFDTTSPKYNPNSLAYHKLTNKELGV